MQILLSFLPKRTLLFSIFFFACYFLPMTLGWSEVATTPAPKPTPQLFKPTQPPTREFQLSNGLKLIVREDHRAPVAIFQIWYRVGSSYEPLGLTGISHILEHMMFKGTNRLKPGEFSRRVAEYGGVENASTTRDYTVYYELWEASRMPISFELEANRMQHAAFIAQEYNKELNVVMEERRMRTDDDPQAKTYERFMKAAYVVSPYQQPVIGWMEDISRMNLEKVKLWYQTWYAPNNATIVIVGDVKAEAMAALAQRYFGAIPAKKLPEPPSVREIDTLGERRLQIQLPAKLPTLFMAYNVPSLVTAKDPAEAYALRMLAGILDSGHSARIETQLVRKQQIAASAGVDYSLFIRGDSLLTFSGIPNNGHSLAELERAYLDQMQQLKTTLVQTNEMERVKAQVVSSLIYQQDSITSQAQLLGQLESAGLSWRVLNHYLENLQKVTPEQIQQVAQKYLTPDRLTVTSLEPITSIQPK